MPQISLDPQYPVVGMSTGERSILRFVKPFLDRNPNNDAENDLVSDAVMAMFKTNPNVVENPQPDRLVNAAILDWALDSKPDRKHTIGCLPAATVAASVTWAGWTEDATIKSALEKQRQAEEAAQKARDAEKELADIARKSGGHPTQGQKDKMAELAEKADNLRQEAQELAEAGVGEIEKAKDHPMKRHAMKRVVDRAEKAAEDVHDFMQQWGLGEGQVGYGDTETIVRYMRDAKVGDITKLFGRYSGRARQVIAGTKAGKAGSFPEVMETRDFNRMFQSEIAQLGKQMPPLVRLKKIRDYAERGLFGFQPLEAKTENGSCLFYNDWSGSVNRDIAYKMNALALAISRASQDTLQADRVFECYGFDYNLQAHTHNKDTWENQLNWARSYSGGGTDIMAVLTHAMGRIRELHDQGVTDVDICITTDGWAEMDEMVFAQLDLLKKEIGVRLCYIHIGSGINSRLKESADLFIHAQTDREYSEMIEDILDQVATMIGNH